MHELVVDQGGEYAGETYLWCAHAPGGKDVVRFDGKNLSDLLDFLREHGEAGDLVARVRDMLTAQEAMLSRWSEADGSVRRELWSKLHYTADRVRDELQVPYEEMRAVELPDSCPEDSPEEDDDPGLKIEVLDREAGDGRYSCLYRGVIPGDVSSQTIQIPFNMPAGCDIVIISQRDDE